MTIRSRSARAIAALVLVAPTACHAPSSATAAATPTASTTTSTSTTSTRTVTSTDPTLAPRVTATFPVEWRFHAGERAAFAPHAMVVSNNVLASAAGREILQRGGNAVDAAAAVGFALAVAYPAAGNIGGGGFMLIHKADGTVAAMDYREMAPGGATHDMYLDAQGNPSRTSTEGPLASGVPGSVAGMAAAVQKYGRLKLADVIAPALRLAEDGIIVDSALWRSLGSSDDGSKLKRYASASPFFVDGKPIAPGSRLVQRDLARTLRRIAQYGPREFYTGETADSLVAEMQRTGGIINKADLAGYQAIWREPLRTTYRGFTIIGMPPVSSGGTTSFEILNQLETFPSLPAFGSAGYAHLIAETERRAFIDRNGKLCDPAFCTVPVAELTSKAYARQVASTIDRDHASRTPAMPVTPSSMHTTHYSVVDADGNAVSTTTTLNLGFGSGVWVRGAGFFLNDEMDDLAPAPGKPNAFGLVQGEQNAVQPHKRPLSSMTPTIVLDSAQRVLLVVGAAGGPTIISGTTEVVLNVLDHRMTLADAMRAPRLHHQALPDSLTYERNGLTGPVMDSLRAMGHGLSARGALVNVNAIMRVRGGWEGQHEPRGAGGEAGY